MLASSFKVSRSHFIDLGLLLAYKAALDLTFIFFVRPIFRLAPEFVAYPDSSALKMAVAYVGVILCWLAYKVIQRCDLASRFAVLLQLYIIVIPFFALYGVEDLPGYQLGLIILGYATLIIVIRLIPSVKISPPPYVIMRILIAAAVSIVCYVFVGLVLSGSLNRLNFNLSEVYKYRNIYVKGMMPGFSRFVPWTGYCFIMLWMVTSIEQKKWQQAFMALGLQILLFGMTNYKAFLFLPFVILIMMELSRRSTLQRAIQIGAPAMLGLMLFVYGLGQPYALAILRRIYFVPAALHTLYFSFYSSNPMGLMSGTKWGEQLGSPYSISSVALIGRKYFGTGNMPNVGWIGDSYADFGVLGVIIEAIILGILLKIADALAGKYVRPGVIEGLLFGSIIALCSASLLVTFLSEGLFVAIIGLWLVNYSAKRRFLYDAALRFDGSLR